MKEQQRAVAAALAQYAATTPERSDMVDAFMAGEGVFVSLSPARKRKVLREMRIRRAVEEAEDAAEVRRRLSRSSATNAV
jgi:hypothetical protein